MNEWLAACAARDACLAAVGPMIVAIVLVAVTIYYAFQTRQLVVEQQRDRAATFLPLLHWQSPRAACGVSAERNANMHRRQLNVVLWNIGPGAARVTLATAANSEGTTYQIAHFDTPSIVPAHEQLTLRIFRDETVEEVLERNDANFLRDEEIRISLHYSDVVEHHHYETHVTVRCHFADASGKMTMISTPLEPPEVLRGFEVRTSFAFSDPRSARERLLANCEPCRTL
jgi:hypothetical protein